MAVNINLLPGELKVSSGLSQVLRIVRMIGVISLAAFLVFGLGVAAFFIFSTVELNGLNSTNTNLKGQLSALSTTEQQFVALKDRLAKIKSAQSQSSATKYLTDFVPFIAPFTGTTVNELDVDPGKLSVTLNFHSNSDLSTFIKSISSTDIYKNVTVNSFGFSPLGGYLVNLTILAK